MIALRTPMSLFGTSLLMSLQACNSQQVASEAAPAVESEQVTAAARPAQRGRGRGHGKNKLRKSRHDRSAGDNAKTSVSPAANMAALAGDAAIKSRTKGSGVVTCVSAPAGDVAVRLVLPRTPRYDEGAPIIVEVPTFFTRAKGFKSTSDLTLGGLIHVQFLWPGLSDSNEGVSSGGDNDHGGDIALSALVEVGRFALGEVKSCDGRSFSDLTGGIQPLQDNVGFFAFSHPGLAAIISLARFSDRLAGVRYYVGRENPTTDTLSAMEIGYYQGQRALQNPLYQYPRDYTPTKLLIDYSTLKYEPSYQGGTPYFDVDGDGFDQQQDYILGPKYPTMWSKRYYSAELLAALRDNGQLSAANWPADLATPEEAARVWAARDTTNYFPTLKQKRPDLKVMLVFAKQDHVQVAPDKPHIHQAYDGFRHTAGLWTRLNMDRAYSTWLMRQSASSFPDNKANTEPADWSLISTWAYDNVPRAQLLSATAVAEMADRVQLDRWDDDLSAPLVDYPAPFGR